MRSKTWILALVLPAIAISATAQRPPSPSEIARAVKNGKAVVVEHLKDPGSARFRNLFVASEQATDTDGKDLGPILMLCGEVNAKNSYGGYEGFKRFGASVVPFFDSSIESEHYAFEQVVWNKACANKVRDVK